MFLDLLEKKFRYVIDNTAFSGSRLHFYVESDRELTKDDQTQIEKIFVCIWKYFAKRRHDAPPKATLELLLSDMISPELLAIAVNGYNAYGESVLAWAASSGLASGVELLINAGADINRRDLRSTVSVLYHAIDNRLNREKTGDPVAVVECLLKHGANPLLPCYLKPNPRFLEETQDMHAFQYARRMGHLSILKALQNYAKEDIFEVYLNGKTPLYYAIAHKQISEALWLIDSEVDINHRDKQSGNTYLMQACETENILPIIHKLLEKKISLNDVNHSDHTPLQLAAKRPFGKEYVERLLEAGANKNELFWKGHTMLMHTLCWKDEKSIQALLADETLDIDEQTADGETALMIAVKKNFYVKEIINRGANPDLKDNSGRSAVFYVGEEETLKLLIDANVNLNLLVKGSERFWSTKDSVLHHLINVGSRMYKILIELLARKAFTNEVINFLDTSYRCTVLQRIYEDFSKHRYVSEQQEIAKLLLKAGASPKITLYERCLHETFYYPEKGLKIHSLTPMISSYIFALQAAAYARILHILDGDALQDILLTVDSKEKNWSVNHSEVLPAQQVLCNIAVRIVHPVYYREEQNPYDKLYDSDPIYSDEACVKVITNLLEEYRKDLTVLMHLLAEKGQISREEFLTVFSIQTPVNETTLVETEEASASPTMMN